MKVEQCSTHFVEAGQAQQISAVITDREYDQAAYVRLRDLGIAYGALSADFEREVTGDMGSWREVEAQLCAAREAFLTELSDAFPP